MRWGGWSFVSLLALACAAEPAAREPAGTSSPAVVVPDEPPSPDAELARALAREAVYHDDYARSVLYTWTTAEQVAELAGNPRLLTRRVSPTRGPSQFDRTLADLDDAPSRTLLEPELSFRRFAWANPWGARLGWPDETYGDRLIRVALRPGSIIAKLDRMLPEPWSFVDLDGRDVAKAEALAHPERIAAVYHVHRGGAGSEFREYVLCNESRIASWEHAGARLGREIEADVRLLERVRSALRDAELERFLVDLPKLWETRREPATLLEHWGATLAFVNPRYLPSNLSALIAALLSTPSSDPLSHDPSIRFTDQAEPQTPPPQTSVGNSGCDPSGTFPCAKPRRRPPCGGSFGPPCPPKRSPVCGGTFGPCPAPSRPCGGTFGPPCPNP